MPDYVLSNKAESDLTEIYVYSFRAFGEAKDDSYFLGLRDFLQELADNPHLGRSAAYLRTGLFCPRYARHIVFYMAEAAGIFVVRILHDAMDIQRNLSSDSP